MLRVIPIDGEPTRFHVEGHSLKCINCDKLTDRRGFYSPGDNCPKCGGVMESRFHLVDLAVHHSVGWCDCERYSFVFGPRLSKMTKQEHMNNWNMVCSHIEEAQKFYAHARIMADERHRLEKNHGRAEEAIC